MWNIIDPQCEDWLENLQGSHPVKSRIKLGHQIIQGFSINNVLPSGGLQFNKFDLEDTSSDAETNQEEEEES